MRLDVCVQSSRKGNYFVVKSTSYLEAALDIAKRHYGTAWIQQRGVAATRLERKSGGLVLPGLREEVL
jgi:hypothetical protein